MAVVSPLRMAITRALKNPGKLAECLRKVGDQQVENPAEARLVVELLALLPLSADHQDRFTALDQALGWIQRAEARNVVEVFRQHAMPQLLRISDETLRALENGVETDAVAETTSSLVSAVATLCSYAAEGGLSRLVAAARASQPPHSFRWWSVFELLAADDHPWRAAAIEALRRPLLQGDLAAHYVSLANTAAREQVLPDHPFDTPEGHALLECWLNDGSNEHAYVAAATLPFLGDDARRRLAELARRHPAWEVRLEAAWAAAFRDEEAGVCALQEACLEPRYATAAIRYLEELDLAYRIPLRSRAPDFAAMAEMCSWLAHPAELGRPPEVIEQVDTRELVWPPTDDHRRVWLFRYESSPPDGESEPEVGFGMVGSVTFAMFGESSADRTPEEVYGLHCAWELEVNHDPRAPEKRTAEAGMRILAAVNPGFGG
jgi:hypothetical protein